MSMRNEMIRRWKERRTASGSSTLTDASAAITRPTTAADSEAEIEFRNHALPKIIEAAVVAAFSSDHFREAVASMVDPAFTRQHDKLNQLKLASLNLESMVQTRLDELPSLLQPALDHMTSIKVPGHEKELEKLAASQDGCLHLLELFGEKIGGIEEQLQGFDGRMKALEEKVVNADLRSAIRFGEISNELHDRNATLNDRLWEVEREVGGKIDGQQRRIVGFGEDFGKGMRKIQEKISDLEALNSGPKDEGSTFTDDLLARIEKMSKSLSKIEAMEGSLRRDIHAVSSKVSSIDTSSLESYPRRFEAIERTMSGFKEDFAAQRNLASVDSKLLSANNARLDTVASNVTKLGFFLESVKDEISNDDAAQSQVEKLEAFDVKIAGLLDTVGAVLEHVTSLDTSALTSHSAQLGDLTSSLNRVEDQLKHVGSLDTSALASHSAQLGDLASGLTRIEDQLKLVDTAPLTSHSERLGELSSAMTLIQSHLNQVDTTPLASHLERLEELSSGLALIQSHLSQLDTTPLSSHSETLFEIESRIAEMRETIDTKFSSQAESLGILNGKVSSLPHSSKVDLILASLKDTQMSTSSGIESLANTIKKILDNSFATEDALSSNAATMENTSQALKAFQTETSDALRPISSKLDEIKSQVDFGDDTLSDTLANMSEKFHELTTIVGTRASETNTSLAKIIPAVEASGSAQTAATECLNKDIRGALSEIQSSIKEIHGSQGEIHKNMQDMHGSTMSELRHKDASILAEVQKSNASHAEHASRFDELNASAEAHLKSLEDGFANLRTVGTESHTRLESIFTTLDAAKSADAAHATALEELLSSHKKHSSSLEELHATSTQFLSLQEKLVPFAETQASAIATLQDSVSRKEDLESLRANIGTVLELLEKHSTTLEAVSTSESISSLSKQISASRDLTASNEDTTQGELKSLKSLLETSGSISKEVLVENNKVRESVAEVLGEVRSTKKSIEENFSTTKTEGAALMEGLLGLKVLAEESKVSSELSEVKGLVQEAKESANVGEAALQAQLKSIIENGEKASSFLTTTLGSIESLKETSSTAPVLERIANLKALVDDIDVNLASVTPEILVGTKAIEHAMMSYARTITEMNNHIQAVKDDPTTSLILTEIGTMKENDIKNADALLAVNDSLSAVAGKIKDSEDATSKSIQQVYSTITEGGASRKASSEALTVDLKRLETTLTTSTNELREELKTVNTTVQANGQVIGASQNKLSDVHAVISKINADTTSIHAEHLPKLSQDIQAINLSKLNTAAVTTEKELASITTALEQLSQLSKSHEALVTSLDGKVSQANDLTSTSITKVQTSLQTIETTISQSAQTSAKSHSLLQSQNPLLETINSSLASSAASTTNTLSALTTTLESIATEVNTISPAVRINSAAISRVDRAVLETGAQIKSVVLDGSAKTSREIDAALEQIDESLHDTNTRLMGISDFEIPRIEHGIKDLEGLVERELDGGVRESRRNGSMLGVIGARVMGTQKLFDEMVDNHERREEVHTGGRSLEGSGVLTPSAHLSAGGSLRHGRGEFKRLSSTRFRSHSNASSGKGSGSGVKGSHT
ncbi:hypothetical protein N431DRAFT_425484 [Stipitochalara longipes BDJ]|nr:hypothetical protein N431DRAFT_425484 [Stipitochalara longipes BDJ]